MNSIKPSRLKSGDTVAVLSPSWGGPSRFPHVFDLGLGNLKSELGLQIKEFQTARMDAAEIYKNPRMRAEDINAAFADPDVSAIFTSIGGDDSVRILPYLDIPTIVANPKILLGYSDTTTLNTYLNQHGLVTFNGPSIMAGFAQMRHLPAEFAQHVRSLLFEPSETYNYVPYPAWADRYVDWDTPGYDGERSPLQLNSEGWHFLQSEKVVQGKLYGGCIEVLEFMKGTRFWPEPSFFDDRILFFETSEDKPTVTNVKYMLRNYGSMGVFDQIQGILFGRARAYSDPEKVELDEMLVQVVSGEFGRSDIPIVSNVDFGHTDPQIIMPLGIAAEIDCNARTFKLTEPAVV